MTILGPDGRRPKLVDAQPRQAQIGGATLGYMPDPRAVPQFSPALLQAPGEMLKVFNMFQIFANAACRELVSMQERLSKLEERGQRPEDGSQEAGTSEETRSEPLQ